MSDTPSYAEARAELARIIGQLESGGQSLEEALALWERGEELADLCQDWLSGAAAKLDERIAAHDTDGDADTDTDTDDLARDVGDAAD